MIFGPCALHIAAGRLRTYIIPRREAAPPVLRPGRTYSVQEASGRPPLAHVEIVRVRPMLTGDVRDCMAAQFLSREALQDALGDTQPIYLATLRLCDGEAG